MQGSRTVLLGMVIALVIPTIWAGSLREGRFNTGNRKPVARLAPGDYRFTLDHGGLTREYELHVPPGYAGEAVPLVVDLHGWGVGSTAQSYFSGFRQKSDEEGFLVAWPQGLGDVPSWNVGGGCCGYAAENNIDDVGFSRAVVADVAARTAIDLSRVYATGQSLGGGMTHRLGCDAADVFAGVAPVAFTLPPGGVDICQPDRPIPVVHFHGLNDPIVAYDGTVPYEGSVILLGAVESHEAWAQIDACIDAPMRILEEGESFCDAYFACADGVINVLCSLNAGHGTYPNPDVDVPAFAWDLLAPYSLPSPAVTSAGTVSGLRVSKHGAELSLTWGPDCGTGDSYNIYRGDLSEGYDSLYIEDCGVNAVQATIPVGEPRGEFFLIVPMANDEEGSYGSMSSGPRDTAFTVCAPQGIVDTCE